MGKEGKNHRRDVVGFNMSLGDTFEIIFPIDILCTRFHKGGIKQFKKLLLVEELVL